MKFWGVIDVAEIELAANVVVGVAIVISAEAKRVLRSESVKTQPGCLMTIKPSRTGIRAITPIA
jgi:hypothetical protein